MSWPLFIRLIPCRLGVFLIQHSNITNFCDVHKILLQNNNDNKYAIPCKEERFSKLIVKISFLKCSYNTEKIHLWGFAV